jgi:hypothetical protein
MLEESSGLQLKEQSSATLTLGKTGINALTAVVFPDPFGPRIRSPPIFGLTALRISANFKSSRETMAENGYVVCSCIFI